MLQVKCSAVELLEAMLEETSPHSAAIKKGLQSAVDVDSLLRTMVYFHKMSTEKLVTEKLMDDDAERGKFQTYRVLVCLADSDYKIGKAKVYKRIQMKYSLPLTSTFLR